MGFKLAIGDIIEVPVTGTVKDGAADVSFSFTLLADRMGADQYRSTFGDDSDRLVRDVLLQHVKGWRGQRLVVDDATGQPADFSQPAFEALLGIVGMETIVIRAYTQAMVAASTAAGRAKNS